jgi:DUF4097 and DUF4098 domain-containing protein YvlB
MRFLAYVAVVLIGVPVVPATAHAQVYPERIVIKEKARLVTSAYQRRNRDDENREQQIERTTKTVRLGSDGVLELGNIAGDITVTRGGGSEATIEIVKTARGRDAADAKEALQLVQVEVSERAGRAEVKTRYPGSEGFRRGRRNLNVSVDYTVTAPAGTRVTAESISGNVKIADIKGDLNASTVSGDVRITGAGRIGSVKSISGSVEVTEAQTDGTLESASVSGDVILRRVKARRIDAGSVSGNVKLEDVQCDRVEAHSTSGNISFSGALARNGRYELNAFSGEIRVVVPANSGFELDANSFSGEVRTEDLPITIRGSEGRSGHRKVLHGTYGDGSAILDLTTFSGSIVISKR